MPKADADPHGGIEAWKDLEENEICGPGTNKPNISFKDEMH